MLQYVLPLFIAYKYLFVSNLELIQYANMVSGECGLFTGDWMPNPSDPFYTNQNCLAIEGHQNSIKNGRSNSRCLYWRWNSQGCDLPKFNSKKFLDLIRNKSWVFVGDSISHNHIQSFLCILSKVKFNFEDIFYMIKHLLGWCLFLNFLV